MNERLLQYIWQHQYYNTRELTTTEGDDLAILRPGNFNSNQGPDFLDARVMIGKQLLAGHIELHVLSSDWFKHMHDTDSNYSNVILHVVWRDDMSGRRPNLPTLVLDGRVSMFFLRRLLDWNNNSTSIPCANQVSAIPGITLAAWKERLVIERLQNKSGFINELLVKSGFHWEEVLWWLIARSFGLVINAQAMMAVAMSIPLSLLKRHRLHLFQLEAILFGQAGLLEGEPKDEYMRDLADEFRYFKDKYDFPDAHSNMMFLRMRPPAFPTIRLAQMAMFLHHESDRLQTLVEMQDIADARSKLNVNTSEYWNSHFVFGARTSTQVRKPGEFTIAAVLINAIIPFMYNYGEHFARSELVERSVQWLTALPREQNKVTRAFENLGMPNATGLDSQAFIQLKSKYCDHRRCLDCAIGHAVLSDRPR